MTIDVTPLIPRGKNVVESYGNGKFKISGMVMEGSVIILPDEIISWPVGVFSELTEESFGDILRYKSEIELLLIGCGKNQEFPETNVISTLKSSGIMVEFMDTGAACRTYNILLAEGRMVAAALIAD